MEHLERLSRHDDATWYALRGGHASPVERYVVSTPTSRRIVNDPTVLGVEFNLALEAATTAALRHAPFRALLADHPEERLCVLNFLRGGLNFELRRALHNAYGVNRHTSAFMSSQRQRKDGRWSVREDMYRKLDIPQHAILVVGDVVATGVTLGNGFEVMLDHVIASGASLRAVVLFTVGGSRAEAVLADVDARARAAFPAYDRTVVVYLEGRFHMVGAHEELRIGIPGTDLVRCGDAVLAPELVRSQYDALPWTLERCAIYDAGSRAFDVPRYLADVREYWEQLRDLARDGLTLGEALVERYPVDHLADADTLARWARERWRGVDQGTLDDLLAAHHRRWRGPGSEAMARADALVALCDDRLRTLAPEAAS